MEHSNIVIYWRYSLQKYYPVSDSITYSVSIAMRMRRQ